MRWGEHIRWKMTGWCLTIISQEQAVTALTMLQHSSVISSSKKTKQILEISLARSRKPAQDSAGHLELPQPCASRGKTPLVEGAEVEKGQECVWEDLLSGISM